MIMGFINKLKQILSKNNDPQTQPNYKTGSDLDLYITQINDLEIELKTIKNKELLYLKQIDGLINDKEELRDKVKIQLQELQLKESELNRQKETIYELNKYKERATEQITDQIIIKELNHVENELINYMAKIKKTYKAREIEDNLNMRKNKVWTHIRDLEKKGYVEIHGTSTSKYFILTGKHKETIYNDI